MKKLYLVLLGVLAGVCSAVATALNAGTPVKAAVVGALVAGASAVLGWAIRTYGPDPTP